MMKPTDYQWTEEDGPMPKFLVSHFCGDVLVHVGFADTAEQAEQVSCLVRAGDHWDLVVLDLKTMEIVK